MLSMSGCGMISSKGDMALPNWIWFTLAFFMAVIAVGVVVGLIKGC
ncbi:hypothetical protein ES703_78551 [subsurface metagenome]